MTLFDLTREWFRNIPHLKLDFEREKSAYEHLVIWLCFSYIALLLKVSLILVWGNDVYDVMNHGIPWQ